MIWAFSLHFKFSAKDQPVTGQVAGAPLVLPFLLNWLILRVNVGDALSSWLLQVGMLWTLTTHLQMKLWKHTRRLGVKNRKNPVICLAIMPRKGRQKIGL